MKLKEELKNKYIGNLVLFIACIFIIFTFVGSVVAMIRFVNESDGGILSIIGVFLALICFFGFIAFRFLKRALKCKFVLNTYEYGEPEYAIFEECYDDEEVKFENISLEESLLYKLTNIRECYVRYKTKDEVNNVKYDIISKETFEKLSKGNIEKVPVLRYKNYVTFDEESFKKLYKE